MKNVLIIIMIGCFAAATFLNFKTSSAMDEGDLSLSALTLSQAAGEYACLTRPGENTGRCRSNVEGGYNCVDAYWFEWNNCIGDTNSGN